MGSRNDADKASHDKAIAGHSVEALRAILKDLSTRKLWNRKDHETRWLMDRRAAVIRRMDRENLLGKVAA